MSAQLTIIDEYSWECLAIRVARRLNSQDVMRVMTELFMQYGVPRYLSSDNGAEMTARVVVEWWRRHDDTVRPRTG
jgi:putative transposase